MARQLTNAARKQVARLPTSLEFFGHLQWIDGRPLLDTIEPYRRHLFQGALDTCRANGTPVFNLVLSGRGKKNFKTADLVLAALYVVVIRRSPLGNDAIIAASDEGQASDDLALARKLVDCNPDLIAEIETLAKELRLRDGSGSVKIIPARDVSGAHGKTYGFLGIDELHTARDWSFLEALAPDPTRDALTWITSYDSIFNSPGAPLYDLKLIGKAGTDPRIRNLIAVHGVDSRGADWVVADLKKRSLPLVHARPVTFDSVPEECRPHLAQISWELKIAYQTIMSQWIADFVKIEVDLYRARFERPRIEVLEGGAPPL